MQRLLISNAHLFGPVDDWSPGWLLTEGKHIHRLGPGQPPDFPPGYVSQAIDADGAVRLPDGQLAGSILTMERALQNILQATGLPLRAAWPMTSLNAARAIGVSARKGSLEVGKDADLVLLDSSLAVRLTVAEGAIIYPDAQ